MAPPARIERVLTYSGVKTTWSPMILVAAQSADVISALRTVDRSFPLKAGAKCVLLGAPCRHRCATRRLMAATAHARGWTIVPYPVDYSLTPFFCIIKRRPMKIAAAQVAGEAVVAGLGWVPINNWMSRRVKGVETVSVTLAQYSPGRSRKKNAIQAMSEIARYLGEPPWTAESMKWSM